MRRTLAAAVPVALALALASTAAAQEIGPRPLRLTDTSPHSVFSLLTQFGQIGDISALSFPISLNYRITREVAFHAELPFGYLNQPGQTPAPVVGNIAVGMVASRSSHMGDRGDLRYGVALTGRIPTAPSFGSVAGNQAATLRAVSVFHSARWVPGSASVRLDLDIVADFDPFAVQLEVGGGGVLPIDARRATVLGHYGLELSARTFQGVWAMIEIAGGLVAPGGSLGATWPQHVLTIAPGFRVDLGGVSPSFYVSIPVAGNVDGERPIVLGLEIASF